jgi:hypothetical protein
MKNTIYLILLLTLQSCCSSYDNTVPPGYPFDNNTIELNYTEFNIKERVRQSFLNNLSDTNIIRDSATCVNYFRRIDTTFINSVNFLEHDLIRVHDLIKNVSYGGFQVRVLINHKKKSVVVESRQHYERCKGGFNAIVLNKFIIVPKLPLDYSFTRTH